MDERTENALREIVAIVGRAFATGCTMLSADDERAIAEVLEREWPEGAKKGRWRLTGAGGVVLKYGSGANG